MPGIVFALCRSNPGSLTSQSCDGVVTGQLTETNQPACLPSCLPSFPQISTFDSKSHTCRQCQGREDGWSQDPYRGQEGRAQPSERTQGA